MNSQAHNQLIFIKFANNIQRKRIKSLQQIVLGKLDVHMQNNEIEPLSHTIYQKTPQIIKVKQNTRIHKFTKRKHGKYFLFSTLALATIFLDMIPKEQATKLKIIKSDSIKLLIKSFHRAKEIINKVKKAIY